MIQDRYVLPSTIPPSLWSKDGVLQLPPPLAAAYTAEIQQRGLTEKAGKPPSKNGPTGGVTLDAVNDHFADRFVGSCGRIQLAVLDPKQELSHASDLLIKAFSGGSISILDAPCGAGAASISILTSIAELRKQGQLPALPLDVQIIGGDLSEPAMQLAASLLESIRPMLEEQSIHVLANWIKWDCLDRDNTSEILNSWVIRSFDYTNHCLILANFSDFLHREKKFNEAKPQLDEMIRWTSMRPASVALWVEPPTNSGADFFSRLTNWAKRFRRMILWRTTSETENAHATSRCWMAHAFVPNSKFHCGVHLIALKQLSTES